MGSFDSVTWQALTLLLTVAGLVGTGVLWRVRGPVTGLRMLAVSLLPAAAYLTGTLRLLWEIGDAVVSWGVRLVFSPFVWLGVSLAGVSLVLLFLASFLSRRGVGARGKATALPADRSAPPAHPTTAEGRGAATTGDDDLADIEAILKRHGIS